MFDPGDQSPTDAEPAHLSAALEHALVLCREWEELERVVPSLDAHVDLVDQLVDEQVTVTAPFSPVLAAIADGCSVSEMAADPGLTDLAALRIVNELMSLGLAVVTAPRNHQCRCEVSGHA